MILLQRFRNPFCRLEPILLSLDGVRRPKTAGSDLQCRIVRPVGIRKTEDTRRAGLTKVNREAGNSAVCTLSRGPALQPARRV